MQRNNLRDNPRPQKEPRLVSQPASSVQNTANVNRNNVNGASTTNKFHDDVRQASPRHVISEPSQPFLLSQTSHPPLVSQETPSTLLNTVNSDSAVNNLASYNLKQSRTSPTHHNNTNSRNGTSGQSNAPQPQRLLYETTGDTTSAPQPQSLLYETTGEESDPNVPGPMAPAASLPSHQVLERSTNIDMSTERRRRPARRKPRSQIPRISELAGPLEDPSPEPAAPPPSEDPEVGPLLKRSSSNSIYSLTTVNLGFEAEERRPGSSSSESVGPRSFLATDSESGIAIRTHVYPRMDSDQSLQSNGSGGGGGGRRHVSKKHTRVAPVSTTTPYNTRTPTLGTGPLKPRPTTPDSSRPSSSSSNSSPAPQLRRLAVAARLLHSNRMDTSES
ncbi:mucin-5AC-like [Branchiostoma floridae]|uniref:Mucin-5AC-like n=1 Tax=Branchiostoma floridae TaxID=7739 RepID=A0A9J7N324_BRAFL|nr:mucin-5AC-like [Branchiostoma floridae]